MGFIDRVKKNNTWEKDLTVLLGLIFIILLLNYILASYFIRWDLTEDKRYSLSPKTVEFLKDEENIPDKILFRIYLHGEIPAELKKLESSIREKLDEIRVYADDKIEYEFIDPNEGSKKEVDELHKQLYDNSYGIKPTDFTITSTGENKHLLIWPGAEIIYNGQITGHVQFFQQKRLDPRKNDITTLANSTVNNLEYLFVSAIRRTVTENKKRIGFLTGHGELNKHETGRLRELLAPFYKVRDIELSDETSLLNLEGLIVAQPKSAFSTKDKFLLDQFIMKGGKVMWFIDQVKVNEDSLFLKGESFGIPYNLNLDDQLFKYGVRVNKDLIVSKKASPIYVPNHPQGILPWLFFPVLEGAGTNITKNVDPIRSEYVSSLEGVGGDEITKSIVLTAGAQTKILKAPVRINFNYVMLKQDFSDPYEYNTAILLEGNFTSFFKNHPVVQILKDSMNYQFIDRAAEKGKMLVVSDGEILKNDYDSMMMKTTNQPEYRYYSLNFNKYDIQGHQGRPEMVYGNEEFLQNMIDYVMEDETLIDIRSKSITMRLLDKEKVASQKSMWKFINIVVPLVLILVLAVVMIIIRKRKYAS
ncbi:MAG: gliding motility-associated ABC transporter substrate-binding protein GldG [Crocinitomicaceae bacterium]|nr:gliding motility-associated ABC transporter substrate-binding protein GldG [Crocinitomicaceae bacterium]